MKKLISGITIFTLLMTLMLPVFTTTSYAKEEIKVIVDGRLVEFDQHPILDENNRTLVPIRFVSEALGADVAWDSTSQAVIISKADKLIKLTIGSTKATINDKTYQLDTSAKLLNGRTMVPIRFVSEALNAEVIWMNETKTIYINSDKVSQLSYQEAFVYPKTPEALANMLYSLPNFKGELMLYNNHVEINLKGTGFDYHQAEDITMTIKYTAIYKDEYPATVSSPGVIDYYVTAITIHKLGADEKALLKDILKKYYPTEYEKAYEDSIYIYEKEYIPGNSTLRITYENRYFKVYQGWMGGIAIHIGE